MTENVRVRFAPSPTGLPHVGNLRTALFNWLYARKHDGAFILRIEDTDAERYTPSAEEQILQTLKNLGLEWDEGPFYQSNRTEKYKETVEALRSKGFLYPCYCTPGELESNRKKMTSAGKPPRYSGHCADLTDEKVAEFEGKGAKPALRFRMEGREISFKDGVRGNVSFRCSDIGDFILVRSNGAPVFYLASAVDDIDMGITDVIRGEDHLSNTPRQIAIIKALGAKIPRYSHLSMVTGADGKKLSKREGSIDIDSLIKNAYLPEAINTSIAMLGWSGVSGSQPESLEEMSQKFDLGKMSKSPARFDSGRLDHINSKGLIKKDAGTLLKLFRPLLEESGFPFERFTKEKLLAIATAVRDTIHSPTDAPSLFEQFAHRLDPDEETSAILEDPNSAKIASALADSVSVHADYNDVVKSVASVVNLKGKTLYKPIRAVLTGRSSGPQLKDLYNILGSEEILKRIKENL